MRSDVTDSKLVLHKLKELGEPEHYLDPIANYLEAKSRICAGLTESQRAELYWTTQLKNEKRIETPQHPGCRFAVIVPVYSEKVERIVKQIASLKQQKDLKPEELEIIYVVNNGIGDNSAGFYRALYANKMVIEAVRSFSDDNVFVIDKSSTGNEIPGCNVGKARNRGMAEACLRFHESNCNGILIHTDADTYFDDRHYFNKLKEILNREEDIVAISGNVVWEFSPDANDTVTYAQLFENAERVLLFKKWQALSGFLTGVDYLVNHAYNRIFSGAHMISRSYESAVIGGMFDGNVMEDVVFGLELELLANRKKLKLLSDVDIFAVTALRESQRTQSTIGGMVRNIDLKQQIWLHDPLATVSFNCFLQRIRHFAASGDISHLSLRSMLCQVTKGVVKLDADTLIAIVEILRDFVITRRLDSEDFEFATRILYEKLYPRILFNVENYQRLERFAALRPGGTKIIRHLEGLLRCN